MNLKKHGRMKTIQMFGQFVRAFNRAKAKIKKNLLLTRIQFEHINVNLVFH